MDPIGYNYDVQFLKPKYIKPNITKIYISKIYKNSKLKTVLCHNIEKMYQTLLKVVFIVLSYGFYDALVRSLMYESSIQMPSYVVPRVMPL